MVSVASLLNPASTEPKPRPLTPALPSPASTRFASESVSPVSSPPRPTKKVKMPKDAAIFTRGKVQGKIRFPPWEEADHPYYERLKEFKVFPLGKIGNYHRHIPYNSEKKSFQATGREAFEVYQYTFQLPDDEKVYTVMWDYNIGLVRITPFFKSCNYAKTIPAKMLNSNPGLREICHSITGGALAAQGYWMPFEAARAVARTFCYSIRHVLTPLFGPAFADECLHPKDKNFGNMAIPKPVIEHCTKWAEYFRELEVEAAENGISLASPLRYETPPPSAKSLPVASENMDWESKDNGIVLASRASTDDKRSIYLPSPSSWTDETMKEAAMTTRSKLKPRSIAVSRSRRLIGGNMTPPQSPSDDGSEHDDKKVVDDVEMEDANQPSDSGSGRGSHASSRRRLLPPIRTLDMGNRPIFRPSREETDAAYALIQLRNSNPNRGECDTISSSCSSSSSFHYQR